MPSQKTINIAKRALTLHRRLKGKIATVGTTPIRTRADLSLVYTPGVGAVSSAVAKDHRLADVMTWRRNVVAVVSDGSAVLGLGNVGPLAALPVMEGKCAIFKRFAGVNAVPIVLATQDTEEIIRTVQSLEPSFGAIQLEDISAPRCFEIERRLSETLSIPIMHDDQHGTAIVVLGGLLNALKVTGRRTHKTVRIVLSGAGAAGTATAFLLREAGFEDIVCCDTKGAVVASRKDLNSEKQELARLTNPKQRQGSLSHVMVGADVFIGISVANVVSSAMVARMAPAPIVIAMANPVPEILPEEAKRAGAAVVATGRSDFPNQLNNAMIYPGLFRGMLDRRVLCVSMEMKMRAAKALAGFVKHPTPERIVPTIFESGLHEAIARSVK